MIKVLIVDDSRVAREYLTHILSSDPELQIIGVANSAASALTAVNTLRPDVITMDIHMPDTDGYAATRAILLKNPIPIVIVSASPSARDASAMFRALDAGALAVELRPPGFGHPDHDSAVRELIQTVKLMAEIKVIKRHSRQTADTADTLIHVPAAPVQAGIQAIAIGASIGGPPVLNKILSGLPANFPVPVIIVQHIAAGFVEGFVEWLAGASGFPLRVATHGERFEPGQGYVAPDGYHLGMAIGLRAQLSSQPPEYGSRPSVGFLFRSTAQVLGPRAVGVLLTGMGRDGADDLKLLNDRGAITIAQDEPSSVVHGMPGEAIKLGGATYILSPENIAATLERVTRRTPGRP